MTVLLDIFIWVVASYENKFPSLKVSVAGLIVKSPINDADSVEAFEKNVKDSKIVSEIKKVKVIFVKRELFGVNAIFQILSGEDQLK